MTNALQDEILKLKDKKEFAILSEMLLRSMRKAEYSNENLGHFGIASRAYTHFTSPIRRYPDLEVHRLLKKYLVENDYSKTTINTLENSLAQIATHSSEREVAAVNAERDVDDMKMAEYMENHIGEEFEGVISGVTEWGFFVELPNTVEGLVRVTDLTDDFYEFYEDSYELVGSATNRRYKLGQRVKVIVDSTDKVMRTIDFKLVQEPKTKNI